MVELLAIARSGLADLHAQPQSAGLAQNKRGERRRIGQSPGWPRHSRQHLDPGQ